MIRLSQRIKAARKESGITQEDLAALLGISRRQVARYESGVIPKDEILRKIADLTNYTFENLKYGVSTDEVTKDKETSKEELVPIMIYPASALFVKQMSELSKVPQEEIVQRLIRSHIRASFGFQFEEVDDNNK